MSRVTGLVWDDKPDEFMSFLKQVLFKKGVELIIREDQVDFQEAFTSANYDFVVLDLFDGCGVKVGLDLARFVAQNKPRQPWYPIFVLTSQVQEIRDQIYQELPLSAVLRSKGELYWTAQYIREELTQRGVFTDRKKVFRIYSMKDPVKVRRFVDPVSEQLRLTWHLRDVTISGANLVSEIMDGLVSKMNICGAVVAVCTADDEQTNGTFQPRQNVLLEMGLAIGLNRGLERLIVLQQWGTDKHQQAALPSDLAGVLTMRFKEKISETFGDLESRLRNLGVDLTEQNS